MYSLCLVSILMPSCLNQLSIQLVTGLDSNTAPTNSFVPLLQVANQVVQALLTQKVCFYNLFLFIVVIITVLD